jgi:hypothetical protein
MKTHLMLRQLKALVAAMVIVAASAALAQDFNGDGITDVAIGAPGESVGAVPGAGAVTIIYGAGPGLGLEALVPLPSALITQIGLEVPEAGDAFGASLAWGDFNGDLFDDLAIGAPGEDHPLSGAADAGLVIVLYGSPGGLILLFPPLVSQIPALGPVAFPDPSEPLDSFGTSVAAGDFNLDGFDDLAVGVPSEDLVGGPVDCGMVNVAYGTPGGLALGPGPPIIVQATFPWGDVPEPGDEFGSSLAAGDMDGSGTADLAIGVPMEDFAGDADAGMVNVAYGLPGPGLLPGIPPDAWTQDSPCVPNMTEPGDGFGVALAIGNFDGILGEDLAIGVPFEDVGAFVDCGAVNVIYSAGPPGLDGCAAPTIAEIWHQDIAGVPEANGAGDLIGSSLVAAGFNADPFVDLAIGVPNENLAGPIADAGGVNVIYGAGPGMGLDAFAPVPAQFWSQNSPGIAQTSEPLDFMGRTVTAGDFDGNGALDLVIGVEGENLGAFADAGLINVIYGAVGLGLTAAGPVPNEVWQQNTAGIPDANEAGDSFGSALDNDD